MSLLNILQNEDDYISDPCDKLKKLEKLSNNTFFFAFLLSMENIVPGSFAVFNY